MTTRQPWTWGIATVAVAATLTGLAATPARAADKPAKGKDAASADAAPKGEGKAKGKKGKAGKMQKAAAEPNTLTDAEKAEGWKLLFDGKSADQFRTYNGDKINDKWQVKDGALTLTGKGGDNLITKEQFKNYELSIDYKISPGGNSGLIWHVQEIPGKPPYITGPEIQIQDNAAGHDPQKAGWLYQLYQPPTDPKTNQPIDATKPAGEWNTLLFRIENGKGSVQMNGVKYYEFDKNSADWKERLAKSKFSKWPEFATPEKGYICLQDHGNEVAFRNIKVRPLAE